MSFRSNMSRTFLCGRPEYCTSCDNSIFIAIQDLHLCCQIECNNFIKLLSYYFHFYMFTQYFIFSAEFLAIELALKLIASYFHKHFIICFDSKSVLEALRSNSCTPSFISILQLYNELYNKRFRILFCWLPAHVGIKSNEAARILNWL